MTSQERSTEQDDGWRERLGWSCDLIADSSLVRQRAHVRLAEVRRRCHEALRSYNEVWNQPTHPEYRSRLDCWVQSERYLLPHALWNRPASVPLGTWAGLPYALLYLTWEARYPDEWFAHAKRWGTKKLLLNDLSRSIGSLPPDARDQVMGLIVMAVRRDHRCEDVGYATLARTLDGPELRVRLKAMAAEQDETHRSRALYLLWLLDHPEASRPKKSQWLSWLAGYQA